jgi:opacity protein-like surface antigen
MAFLSLRRRLAVLAVVLIANVASAVAAQQPLTEAQARAGFLYNCAMFIEWPTTAIEGGELVIGVVGAGPVISLMNDMQGRKVNGRVIRIRSLKPTDDLHGVNIVFLGGDARSTLALLARIGDAPVLTVGEQDDFTAKGGVVRLYTDQDRLRFEINMTRAEQEGLKVSAKMLGLAKIVR